MTDARPIPIFHSNSDRECGVVEDLLTDAEIEYSMRLEPMKHADGICYQGLLFEVAPADAARAKQLLAEKGLEAPPE